MTIIRSRTFCCCIPVRLGVVITALLGLMGGGILAIVGGLEAHRIDGSKVSIAISIAVYGLLAFVSLLGLFGAIGRSISLIKLYFGVLLAHLFFSIGIGAYAIHRVFTDAVGFYDTCIVSEPATQEDDPGKYCNEGVKLVKGITVTLFIVVWLFEIWGCIIVSSYARQLQDENNVSGVVKDTEAW